jgi:hypothetical protein
VTVFSAPTGLRLVIPVHLEQDVAEIAVCVGGSRVAADRLPVGLLGLRVTSQFAEHAVEAVIAGRIVRVEADRFRIGRRCVLVPSLLAEDIAEAGLGLVLGTSFEPRNIGLMSGFIILPITFLGGTYCSWTKLAPVTVGGWHWLQAVVLINPLIYVYEGVRAAFTTASHMHLDVIYPVVTAFGALFLSIGLRNFRRCVLSLIRLVGRLWSAVHGNRDLPCRKPGSCNDLRSRHGRLVSSAGLTCRHTL